ncbi:MAG: GspE/PulE family protein, partial [Myxococcota bacterium]
MSTDRELTFEALLGRAVQTGLISSGEAQRLFEGQDRQRELLLRERQGQVGANGPPSARARRTTTRVSALELLLSFRPKAASGELLAEDTATELYADALELDYVKLDPLKLDPEFITAGLSKPFARKHSLIALQDTGDEIQVATSRPEDRVALQLVAQRVGKPLELVIASHSDIQRIITEFYGFRGSVKQAAERLQEGVDIGNFEQLMRLKTEREIEASDQHVVHAVEYLLSYAFQQRASDVHIEPKRDASIVRFRIDGSLHEVQRLPKVVHAAVINRIKTLARLDIGEKRRPQDGRIKTEFAAKSVEIRVSTLPVAFGEKAVLRVFDPDVVQGDLGSLGFFERDLEIFAEQIARPHGIILVTGPTGSGKTTTLYTALRRLSSSHINVTTIEDPIEMVFEPINQTAIQPGIGLGFAETLRTILRQDPDVIMVGEIRDQDTARYAVQASLTGHLVLSTLHTNDAASAVTRLMDLGLEHFLLASTLSLLVAQRLVKRVCGSCRDERPLTEAELDAVSSDLPPMGFPGTSVMTSFGRGCASCRQTGYHGRCAVYEVMPVGGALSELILGKAD